MKSVFASILLSSLLLINFACSAKDGDRYKSNKRIISLSPHITEIIYALGQDDELLAVTDYCRYPESAKLKEKIGGLIDANIEKIVSLRPNLLFGVPAHAQLNQELAKFDLQIIMLANESISDVLKTIDTIGVILDCRNEAKTLIQGIRDTLKYIESQKTGSLVPSALLAIGRERGTLRNITASGSNTYMDEIWKIAGGHNLFADLPTRYATINIESILKGDPDVIVEFDVIAPPGIMNSLENTAWRTMTDLKAVRNGHVFVIGDNYSVIPGPRMVKLARDFRNIIDVVNADVRK